MLDEHNWFPACVQLHSMGLTAAARPVLHPDPGSDVQKDFACMLPYKQMHACAVLKNASFNKLPCREMSIWASSPTAMMCACAALIVPSGKGQPEDIEKVAIRRFHGVLLHHIALWLHKSCMGNKGDLLLAGSSCVESLKAQKQLN